MMPFMLSYPFHVLHTVACFVPVIFHHVIVAISPNVASHSCLSDPVGHCLLIVPILVLILSNGPCCANRCKNNGRKNRILHVSSSKGCVVWADNYRFYDALSGIGELSKITQSEIPAGYNPGFVSSARTL